jgi:hypothetical protein
MMKIRTRWILPCLALAILAAPLPSAEAAAEATDGVRVLPKANKRYLVEGTTLSFTELETRLSSDRPARIIVEQSRQPKGAACMVMLAIKLDIPVWTRSLNGRMQKLKIDVESSKVDTIDSCR